MNKFAKLSIVVGGVLAAGTALASDYDRDGDHRGYHERARGNYDDRDGAYIGVNVGEMRYSEDGLNTITPTVAMFRIGAPLGPNFGVEGRVGRSLGTIFTDGYGLQVQSIYAGYLKGSVPLSPVFSLYALGGAAAVNLQRDFGQYNSRDSGVSFGFGADFNLPGSVTLDVEWVRLPSGNNLGYDYTNDMASVGVAWHF